MALILVDLSAQYRKIDAVCLVSLRPSAGNHLSSENTGSLSHNRNAKATKNPSGCFGHDHPRFFAFGAANVHAVVIQPIVRWVSFA
jgi:hypothetical protein